MTKPIAIFYHCLLAIGEPTRVMPQAGCIVSNQMTKMQNSGLWDAAAEIHVGLNGGAESESMARNIIPGKAKITYHGLQNRNENLTVVMAHEFSKTHPGWNILYFHAKSSSHPPESDYAIKVASPWREAMDHDLILNWRICVPELDNHDIVCSRWLWDMGWDKSQHIPCGNFLWITSDFLSKLPSMYDRARIKEDGIGALSSRYESEVHWGNGAKPVVKQYRPNGGGGVP